MRPDLPVPNGVEMTDRGPWIGTLTGRFYPFDPRAEEVFIEDIAHSLSLICRYNGHIDRHYSVAEHSMLMANACNNRSSARWALMHDAAEAYVGDIVRPVKMMFPEFSRMEDKVMEVICEKFGLTEPKPEDLKWLDDAMSATEKRDLKPDSEPWTNMPDPLAFTIMSPHREPLKVKRQFLKNFYILFPDYEPTGTDEEPKQLMLALEKEPA